jgi:DNA-binding NarL/FixJ family response regulator
MRYTVFSRLSPREKDVIKAIIEYKCLDVSSIAERLIVSKSTVSRHLFDIYLTCDLPKNSIAGIVWRYYNQ